MKLNNPLSIARPLRSIFALVFGGILCGCIQDTQLDSYDLVCESFGELAQKPDYESLEPIDRNQWILTEASRALPPDAPALQAWFTIASAPGEERYQLFAGVVEDSGKKGWHCEAMRLVAHEVGNY